jgi:hypothetical protein
MDKALAVSREEGREEGMEKAIDLMRQGKSFEDIEKLLYSNQQMREG